MRRDPRRQRGGFTLIEIVVALGLFVVGMVTLQAMQLHALRGGSSGRHTTAAAAIAQSQMEQLQRRTWTQIPVTAGWAPGVTRTTVVQSDPNQVEQAYTLDWRITSLEPGWTRSIDVRVRWAEPQRPNRSITLTSVRFNREGA